MHGMEPEPETCVVTGKPAFARHGEPVIGIVKGWYGSTVVDAPNSLVSLDPALPVGPLCDDVLNQWLQEGRLIDPEDFKELLVDPGSADPSVIEALVDAGARIALHYLDTHDGEKLTFNPSWPQREYLAYPFIETRGVVLGEPRHPGPDFMAVGRIMALVRRARGRPFDEAERREAVAEYVEGYLSNIRLHADLDLAMSGEERPQTPERKPAAWLRGVVVNGVAPEELDDGRPPAAYLRSMAIARRFDAIDEYLSRFDVAGHSSITLIGMMRTIAEHRSQIGSWAAFRDAAVERIQPSERMRATTLQGLLEDGPSPA